MEKSIDTKLLSRLGIHEQSVTVYLDLVEHGTSFLHEVSARTWLERMIIYRRLPELLEFELIQREVSGKRYRYRAQAPSHLKTLLESLEDELNLTIWQLEHLYQSKSHFEWAPRIRVSQGHKAVESVYRECIESLPTGGIYYRYSSRSHPNTSKLKLDAYKTLRDAKKIQRMVITNEDLAALSEKKSWRELVAFPNMFPFKQNFQKLIFMDRIAIIDIETFTVMIIESKLLASFEQAIFVCLFHYLRAEKEGRFQSFP